MKLYKIPLVSVFLLMNSQPGLAMDYPEGYRHWSHVKTLTLHAGHPLENPFKGIHHVYANPAALKGLQSGAYADGATFVFDLLENVTADHASAEGDRVLIGVMQKDSKGHAATGGWAFQAWSGNSRSERLVNDGGQSCYACHTDAQKDDYVFSHWRE